MDGLNPLIFLLLGLSLCAQSKETAVKNIVGESDITPICIRKNLGIIVFVRCRISTERHHGEECCLIPDKKYDCEFDSRFTLLKENQTVFLHLTGLTPVDRGSYTCECSYERGTHVVQLNITVQEQNRKLITAVAIPLSVAATFTITAGIICAHTWRRKRRRDNTRSAASELTIYETPEFVDQDESYAELQRQASDVYHNVFSSRIEHDAEAETDLFPIYTSIKN